ncbi:DNA-(apurinic or apyrimidinic site) lyase [Purpureocillium takamizusanense]|uniref:DNA-(Apurinic or apyrimidinic site) lyase n=1 Tax=Purpureocillium takamizusanense TaxID=2060973 RepID=A0A9Q8QC10_9HYPO|nr:DNA-(apurinic or apyrimidinic site) lyase [Purpureocillium takamizusanense]UNI17889.1 DNA-(apurinic or apyrimidinic site) lyase [Purpureocillium takamizusanense]
MAGTTQAAVLRRSARTAQQSDDMSAAAKRTSMQAPMTSRRQRGPKREAVVQPEPLESGTTSPRKRIKVESTPSPEPERRDRRDAKIVVNSDANVLSRAQTAMGSEAKDPSGALRARKLKSFTENTRRSPFPGFGRPTAGECSLAHLILADLHGDRVRPKEVVAPTATAGCGASPSVLDALVRTILSQNTSDKNSSRAKQSMDDAYGGSDKWEAIVEGGQAKLQRVIQSGGLSVVKSKVIISILQQTQTKHGSYSLDHLFSASDEDAMRELLSFQGVGPKTASCVLLFCLQRPSFAVDTHVYRITGLLGWRPPSATREEAQAHLDAMVPDDEKYPLHVLIISHGKQCAECKAGGKALGKCRLRKTFRKGVLEGLAGDDVKIEVGDQVKHEEE